VGVVIEMYEDSTEGAISTDEVTGEEIGKVFKFFSKVGVAAINITSGSLKVGDTIRIKGATTDFTQQIDSMEIDRQKVDTVGVGQSIGIKVKDKVRENDIVYKL
jgi:putative protease